MELAVNGFKCALSRGDVQIGLWCTLASGIATEIVSDSGFDWLLIDTEHSPNEVPDLVRHLQAMQRGSAAPVVRVAWNDPVLIKRVLDVGAQTILVPYVQNADEAARAVGAARYPPSGLRGVTASGRASRYGRVKEYLQKANDEIGVVVQVETREALEQLEAIAMVEGIDGVFVGPSDLSASLGLIGRPQSPEVQEAIEKAAARIRAAGKSAGVLAGGEGDARRYMGWGYNFVAVGVDTVLLARAADELAERFKAAVDETLQRS
jgi:4-hydroxy-2-oxoheptanedioate aldolase